MHSKRRAKEVYKKEEEPDYICIMHDERKMRCAALHFRLSFFHWQFSVVFATVQKYELKKAFKPLKLLESSIEDRKGG